MKQLSFWRFNNNERFLLLQIIVRYLSQMVESNPEVQPQLTKLKAIRDKMERSLNKSRGSEYTSALNLFDQLQDSAFRCFRLHLEANAFCIIGEGVNDKARQLEEIVRRHGWTLYSFGMKKQLAVSLSLIAELKEEDKLQMIDDLGLRTYFDAWVQAAGNFETKFHEKVEDDGKNGLYPPSENGHTRSLFS